MKWNKLLGLIFLYYLAFVALLGMCIFSLISKRLTIYWIFLTNIYFFDFVHAGKKYVHYEKG